MKKAIALLFTIVLLALFSYQIIFYYETKSMSGENIKNQYLYLQAKNHISFLDEYIDSINLKDINTIEIEDKNFEINANIEKKEEKYHIFLEVTSKKYDIRITKQKIR